MDQLKVTIFLPSLRGKTRIRRWPSSPGVARFVIAAGNTRGKTGLSTSLGAGGAFFINVLIIILLVITIMI